MRYRSVILLLSLLVLTFPSIHIERSNTAISQIIFSFQKGFSYAAWWNDTYLTDESDESLENLRSLGVEWVSIITTWYQEDESSTEITPDVDATPSDDSIVHAIDKIHSLGMKVMLKPHVDLHNGKWRGEIEFDSEVEWREWFQSYKRFICHYAKLAEQNKVEQFCIGCELVKTTQRREWLDVIEAVRENFSGTITYAADWSNYKNVTFWDMLDFVGIDAYFPLTDSNNPDLDELIDAWKRWKTDIESFFNETGKEIVFTEIGYRSIDGCNRDPWNWWRKGQVDLKEQLNCYEAAFKTFFEEDWFGGFFWWMWYPNTSIGGAYDDSYTPYRKPAENVVKAYYKNEDFIYTNMEKPKENRIYLFDREIASSRTIIILGRITITAEVFSTGKVEKVEFYVDDEIRFVDYESPYQWVWRELTIGWHQIGVIAYDERDNKAEDNVTVFTIII